MLSTYAGQPRQEHPNDPDVEEVFQALIQVCFNASYGQSLPDTLPGTSLVTFQSLRPCHESQLTTPDQETHETHELSSETLSLFVSIHRATSLF